MSEGIDFSNELCRAVFIVSIPFPNTKDPVLGLKMQWLDKHGGKFNGNAFYMQQTFDAVNQAIGRVVRHKEDYGAVYLLDQRYVDNVKYLPNWVRSTLTTSMLEQQKDDQFFINRKNCPASRTAEKEINFELLEKQLEIHQSVPKIQKPMVKVLNAKQMMLAIKEFQQLDAEQRADTEKQVLKELEAQGMSSRYQATAKQTGIALHMNLAKLLKQFQSDQQIIVALSKYDEACFKDILSRFM